MFIVLIKHILWFQEHAGHIEKMRRALESQVKELQVRLDEAEASAMKGGKRMIQKLEQRVGAMKSPKRTFSALKNLFETLVIITNFGLKVTARYINIEISYNGNLALYQ